MMKINIPEPCHENWQNMTPTDKGAFCASCAKEVIDFSRLSDPAVAERLSAKESLCGRFLPEQLDRELRTGDQNRQRNTLTAAAFAVLATLSAVQAKAQDKTVQTEQHVRQTGLVTGKVFIPENKTVRITVVDGENRPVRDTQVFDESHNLMAVTGEKGEVEIYAAPYSMLYFESEGYMEATFQVQQQNAATVTLRRMMLGEIAVIRKRSFFGRILGHIGL